MGTVRGRVVDPSGAVLPGAQIQLNHPVTGFQRKTFSNEEGRFVFHKLPLDRLTVSVELSGFKPYSRALRIPSNIPVELEIRLELAGTTEELTVAAPLSLSNTEAPGTRTDLDGRLTRRLAGGGQLQQLVATVPGWATEDNGLLHARGVDDGFLYVVDGIPVQDRVDTFFAAPWETASIQTIQVINGHLPAEYGHASGGVIQLVRETAIDRPWRGRLGMGVGSFGTRDLNYAISGSLGQTLGLQLSQSFQESTRRYLDPVDPDNLHNRGGALGLDGMLDWQAIENDLVRVSLSLNGSDLRVPHTLEQELAGQRQRQELRGNSQSVSWQRTWSPRTLTNLAWHRRYTEAELFPGQEDTPLVVSHFRRHQRQGLKFDMTHSLGRHLIKVGVEGQRVSPRERLMFFLSEEDESPQGDELNPGLMAFDRENPFRFQGSVVRAQASAYIQDSWQPLQHLTVEMGLRFDHTALLVSRSQLSPRLGVVYLLEGTGTALRGSYNRLFMPPQVENLLLSSSPEARRLSPFADELGEGGAEIPPESQHAFELGFNQAVGEHLRLDGAYWWRLVRNYADPNVFFGTTILFPNSVASGLARGLDLRLDFPKRGGWSGFVSYSNSLVYQEGPINGGLFLEEEVIEIGPGTRFTPDHDQRNVGAFGLIYSHPSQRLWFSLQGRHESGTPLEVDEEELDELARRRGAELVDFDRQRVKARTLFDLVLGVEVFREEGVAVEARLEVRNLGDRRFAYNFGNPFSGTHFGHPRIWKGGLEFRFGE